MNRPHTRLADVLARHRGQADRAETIVDDESLAAQWISMGPVVYVARPTWHPASNGGKEGLRSCRLAMNGFPCLAHKFEQD